MAARNEDAPEPVGRGRGLAVLPPLPRPPNPPDGGVTPCASRHFWKVELCDVPEVEVPEVEVEVELVELPPQAATDTTVASTTAPNAAGLTALRPGVTLNRR